jgi:hypothetical protein
MAVMRKLPVVQTRVLRLRKTANSPHERSDMRGLGEFGKFRMSLRSSGLRSLPVVQTASKQRADCVQPHFQATTAQAILTSVGGDLVAWQSLSLE